MKNYRPLKDTQKVYLKNFYLYENEQQNKLAALFVISKINGQVYFVDFKDLDFNDPAFDNELEMGPQMWADSGVQKYWLQQLVDYIDGIAEIEVSSQKLLKSKKVNLIKIESLDEIFKQDNNKEVNIYQIDEDKMKNVGFVTEIIDDGLLQTVHRLIVSNEKYNALTPELLKDLQNSYNWLLDSIYDN